MPRTLPDYNSPLDHLEPFSKVRLIIADLDGTLIGPEDPKIWENINEQIRSINYYKVKLTIATGRTLHGVENLLKNINIPKDFPIILYNGSLVIVRESHRLILKKTIPLETLQTTIKKIHDEPIRMLAYFYDETIMFESSFNKNNPEVVFGWTNIGKIDKEFNQMDIQWINWDVIPDIKNSLLAILIESNDKKILTSVKRKLKNFKEITITKSGSQYLEIRPADSNKAKAAEQILKETEYNQDEILAIGDNDNDAELLKWSGIGVAVKGASRVALKSSDYICKFKSAHGVTGILRLVKHSRRYFNSNEKNGR
jgi:Cof subfamily protein (haloacid dehalogenase superfamily)